MRRKPQPSVRATDLASSVLPTPVTSSSGTCPAQSSATRTRSIRALLPTTTRSTLARARAASDATRLTSSTLAASKQGDSTSGPDVPFGVSCPDPCAPLLLQLLVYGLTNGAIVAL